MKKTNPNPAPSSTSEPSGSFSMGLFLGVVGGALGMWLFHTDDGEKSLQELKKVWGEWSIENNVSAEVTEKIEQTAHIVQDVREKFPKFRQKLSGPTNPDA